MVLVLSNNRINLLTSDNKLETYKIIEVSKKCSAMAYHPKIGALVFCEDTDGQ
jgi:hypothetical protein